MENSKTTEKPVTKITSTIVKATKLSDSSVQESGTVKSVAQEEYRSLKPRTKRPSKLVGATYKLKMSNDNHSLYLTVNSVPIDDEGSCTCSTCGQYTGRYFPYEIFVNSRDASNYGWAMTATTAWSAILQQLHRDHSDPNFIIDDLLNIHDPSGGAWVRGKYYPSIQSLIGYTLADHFVNLGLREGGIKKETKIVEDTVPPNKMNTMKVCTNCNAKSLVYQDGCFRCLNCDYSKCG